MFNKEKELEHFITECATGIAANFKRIHKNLNTEELISECHYAALKAAENFDESKRCKFSTYAYDMCWYAMLEFNRNEEKRKKRYPISNKDLESVLDANIAYEEKDVMISFLSLKENLTPKVWHTMIRSALGFSHTEIAENDNVTVSAITYRMRYCEEPFRLVMAA